MSKVVDAVCWAVPPNGKANTRPARLIDSLAELGVMADGFQSFYHGGAPAAGNATSAGRLAPRVTRRKTPHASTFAFMSPVFNPALSDVDVAWFDFYDDWSIAPDINQWHRLLARLTYDQIRRNSAGRALVTCNSPYMAGRLGLSRSSVVPNGVDPHLADLPRLGDDARRLVVLGHFFAGRTDIDLIDAIIGSEAFSHVIVAGDPIPEQFRRVLEKHRLNNAALRVDIYKWLALKDIPALCGPRTVGVIPHVVSDYTLSQDPMKIYQFISMGMRVICPRMLWPSHLGMDGSFLVDFGSSLQDNLAGWIDREVITDKMRRSFAETHSWRARAKLVSRMLGDKA